MFGRTYGYFDQKMRVCPDVRCVKLSLPAKGSARATVILWRTRRGTVASPLQVTLGSGDQCTQGAVTLRPTKRGASFP